MAAIGLTVAVLDQSVKAIMLDWLTEGVPQPVIGDWFRFLLLFNPGAAFSMGGESFTWLFTTIQLVYIVAVVIAAPRISSLGPAVGLALIAGGALGNFIDRISREPGFWFGHVVDYISVGNFAVFNIADAAITVGVVVFIFALLFGEGRKEHDAA